LKKIILDTNVFLVSISRKSKLHWIFKNLIESKYILCLTTDILLEYAEIIEQKMSLLASENALNTLENLSNIEFITSYYKFNLLKDWDDNKFVDCVIASNADYIVTHDADFNVLKSIHFSRISIITTLEFNEILN
jgi:putative PIN family toxin of toxin-antitoxin system